MESKYNRIIGAFDSINEAIEDILKNKNNPNGSLKSLTSVIYKKVIEDFREIRKIIYELAFSFNDYKTPKLDEIRCTLLSLRDLFDEKDYELLFSEAMKTNNMLCFKSKNADLERIRKLKSKIRDLPKSIKTQLITARKTENGKIKYYSSKVDNLQFIIDKYVTIKYNFKKIDFDPIQRHEIIEEERYELITYGLNRIIKLCNEEEYIGIKSLSEQLIEKYESSKDKPIVK